MKMLSLRTGSSPELGRAQVGYLCSRQSWSFPKVCKPDRRFQAAVNTSLLHPPGCCQLQFNPPRLRGCFGLPAVTGADTARCRSGSFGAGGAPRAAGSTPSGRHGAAAGARPPHPPPRLLAYPAGRRSRRGGARRPPPRAGTSCRGAWRGSCGAARPCLPALSARCPAACGCRRPPGGAAAAPTAPGRAAPWRRVSGSAPPAASALPPRTYLA